MRWGAVYPFGGGRFREQRMGLSEFGLPTSRWAHRVARTFVFGGNNGQPGNGPVTEIEPAPSGPDRQSTDCLPWLDCLLWPDCHALGPMVIALTISVSLAAAVGFVGDRLARDHTIEAVWRDGERADTTFTRGAWIPTPDDRHIIAFVGELHCHGLAVHFVGTPNKQTAPSPDSAPSKETTVASTGRGSRMARRRGLCFAFTAGAFLGGSETDRFGLGVCDRSWPMSLHRSPRAAAIRRRGSAEQ